MEILNFNKGIVIPLDAILDTDLSSTEKLLMGFLTILDNSVGCYASNEFLAELTHTSKKTCSRSISKLLKKHYINAEYSSKVNIENVDLIKEKKVPNNFFAARTIHVLTKKPSLSNNLDNFDKSKLEMLDFFITKLYTLFSYNFNLKSDFPKNVLNEADHLALEMFRLCKSSKENLVFEEDECKKETIKRVLNKYKELDLPKITSLSEDIFIYKACLKLGEDKVIEALEVMSKISFVKENLSVNSIFKVSNLEKALNGTFKDYAKNYTSLKEYSDKYSYDESILDDAI